MYYEDESTELKKSTSELKEAIVSMVAILNKHGKGKIYFGIKDNGDVVGQQISSHTLRNVSKQIAENIEPRIYPSVSKVKLERKDCILVEFEGDDIPYFAYGRAYMRVGDEDRQLTQKEIKKIIFKVDEKNNKWEDKASSISLDDIDEETVINFIKKGNEKGRINFNYTNKEDVLKKLNLIDVNGKIKNAGYVLFGKELNIQLRAAIFATDTKTTFLDMQDFNGNIFNLIDKGEQYIAKNIRWSLNFNTGTFAREEIPEIPIRAMREILCNSFCHRDWNEPYDNYLAIYKNRIEICNPGFFTEEATPEDYINKEEPSRPRNPLIAQTLYLSGEIERWGSGIRNVYKTCQEDKIKVEFENRKTAFFAVVYRKDVEDLIENTEKILRENVPVNVPVKLTKTEKQIIQLIIKNPNMTQKEIAEQIKITEKTVKRNMNKLKQKGILERIGADKNGYWKIKNN